MIIDAHAHVFANPRIKLAPGATTFMSAIQQIEVMDRFGIDKAVILPLCNPDVIGELQGIDEIINICQTYPGRFVPFCNLDPRLKGSAFYKSNASHFEFILTQYKAFGCKGVGEFAARLYWDEPCVLELLKACENIEFPVTFHTTIIESNDYGLLDEMGFPRFEKVLQKFPKLIFFAHSQSWWAEISSDVKKEDKSDYPAGPVKVGGAVPRLMSKYPQLYGDISAHSGLNALKRDPEYAWEFIDQFQDRLLFGLDYCSPTNEHDHLRWLKEARDTSKISEEAFEKIVWKNITRVLNLDL